jgi:hypothetical protein
MRMLSKGRTKVAVLTTKPADPAKPTVTELDAGIEASCKIPSSMWTWRAGDPTTETDSPLCVESDNEVPVADKYDTGFGVYREFAAEGGFDPLEDALFEAVRVRGTTLWVYARKTDKLSKEAWAADDEIYLGGELLTGTPKNVEGGFIKFEVPLFAQNMHNFIKVGAAA